METLTAATFTADRRRRMASEGVAMPDGTFHIRNRTDLRQALRAMGSAENPQAARVHIEHRARALGLTSLLPDAWAVTAAFDPTLHPRHPSGSDRGGEWAPKGARDIRGPAPGDKKALADAAIESARKNSETAARLHEEGNHEHAADYEDAAGRAYERALSYGVPVDMPDGFEYQVAPLVAPPPAQSYGVRYRTPDWMESMGAKYQEAQFETYAEAEAFQRGLREQQTDSEILEREHPVYRADGQLVASAGRIGLAPLVPPAEWFQNPELPGPTPLTVTADGRVYGHLAEFGKCHRGIAGRCVFAPRSKNGYQSFYAGGQILLDDEQLVPVGRLTVNAHHAPLTASPTATAAHYDHSGTVAAFVRAGEDRHGIWVAGATRSDATPEQIRDLRANPPSGDWRNTEGRGLELVAALAVPVPGFPVMAVAASAYEGGPEQVTALILGYATDEPLAVVAGAVDSTPEVDAAGATIRTRVLAARIAGGVEGLAELFR